ACGWAHRTRDCRMGKRSDSNHSTHFLLNEHVSTLHSPPPAPLAQPVVSRRRRPCWIGPVHSFVDGGRSAGQIPFLARTATTDRACLARFIGGLSKGDSR